MATHQIVYVHAAYSGCHCDVYRQTPFFLSSGVIGSLTNVIAAPDFGVADLSLSSLFLAE